MLKSGSVLRSDQDATGLKKSKLFKGYQLVPSFALKFPSNKKTFKIILTYYADSKNGNCGDHGNQEKYMRTHKTKK